MVFLHRFGVYFSDSAQTIDTFPSHLELPPVILQNSTGSSINSSRLSLSLSPRFVGCLSAGRAAGVLACMWLCGSGAEYHTGRLLWVSEGGASLCALMKLLTDEPLASLLPIESIYPSLPSSLHTASVRSASDDNLLINLSIQYHYFSRHSFIHTELIDDADWTPLIYIHGYKGFMVSTETHPLPEVKTAVNHVVTCKQLRLDQSASETDSGTLDWYSVVKLEWIRPQSRTRVVFV